MAMTQPVPALDDRRPLPAGHMRAGCAHGAWRMEIFAAPHLVQAEWLALEAETAVPFMTYAWAEAWYANVSRAQGDEPVIVLGRDEYGEAAFILPLVRVRRGPFSVLNWPGDSHSAIQTGLFSRACRSAIRQHGASAFWREVFAVLPRADAIAACALPEIAAEADNPLAALPAVTSPSDTYVIDLTPGWDALYHAKFSKKNRTDHRRCERRLGELGEVRLVVARSTAHRLKLVEIMLDQKSAQLRKAGAPDFTIEPGVRAFYRRLAASPNWSDGTTVHVAALESGGTPVATIFGLIQDGTFHALILAMVEGAHAKFSPGRLLVKHTVEACCHMGLRAYQMGAGLEPSKLKWCDTVVARRDVLVPLTRAGHIYVSALRGYLTLKTAIKTSPALWNIFSRYRRFLCSLV